MVAKGDRPADPSERRSGGIRGIRDGGTLMGKKRHIQISELVHAPPWDTGLTSLLTRTAR